MRKISKYTIILFLLASVIYMNCKDDATTSASSCDQSCQDENTAYGLAHVFNFIWNQHFAGQPTGSHDMTVNGPQGGSIHITGTTGFSNGINTANLVFDMTDCKGLDENYSLTFTGIVNIDGTFSSTYKALAYISSQLTFHGTVGKNTNVPVSATCEISINESLSHLSGTICGREFSYK